MCSRYYIDSDMMIEIEKEVPGTNSQILQQHFSADIRPTDTVPVLEMKQSGLQISLCKWGYLWQRARIW